MASIYDLLTWSPLTKQVMKVKAGIPKMLPEKFWTMKTQIPGDRFRQPTFRGNRKVARISVYGAPPRRVERTSRGLQDVTLIHSNEEIEVNHEILKILRHPERMDYMPMARSILEQDAQQFAFREANLEVAAVTLSLAHAKIWYDAEGDLLTSSAGADVEVDFGTPDSHRNQINLGQGNIISASWANPATNIPVQINNLKSAAIQQTGYELKYAFYGANVGGYLATNTSFKDYLARNPNYNAGYVNTGEIIDGTLGLTWIPVQNSFLETEDGTITELFPADQITFYPELTEEVYQFVEGGYPVPSKFATAQTLDQVVAQMEYVFGVFRYAYMMAGHFQIRQVQGTTFLPHHKNGEVIYIADVAF